MDIHKPKPVHSWRDFINEIGVIVIGILIALSAEQVIEAIRTRENVRSFRETIDHEIRLNLIVYRLREQQSACEQRRVGELNGWLDQARSGVKVPPLVPRGPLTLSRYRSAWDNRNAEVFNHLPAPVQKNYAAFYDELSNNSSIIVDEQNSWRLLAPYAEDGPISLADRRVVGPIIGLLASSDRSLTKNFKISREIANSLDVRLMPDDIPSGEFGRVPDCTSVIASNKR